METELETWTGTATETATEPAKATPITMVMMAIIGRRSVRSGRLVSAHETIFVL